MSTPPGLHLTFFDDGESFDQEPPPVGPLDDVVVRHRQVIAERRSLHQPEELGVPIGRWLEAELELQRATGQEPGGLRRANIRVSAPEGVYLRFVSFADPRELYPAPELGPFAVVAIGRRTVEADGVVLARRSATEMASWELTAAVGAEFPGIHKFDIAFRSAKSSYHPNVASRGGTHRAYAPTLDEPRPPAPAAEHARAPRTSANAATAEPETALTQGDRRLIARIEEQRAADIMRVRAIEDERRRLGTYHRVHAAAAGRRSARDQPLASPTDPGAAAEAAPMLDVRELLWRLRFLIIGALLVAATGSMVLYLRDGPLGGGTSVATVSLNEGVTGERFDYQVSGAERAAAAGAARPRGTYLVLQIVLTDRADPETLASPSQFTLVDSKGNRYGAEPLTSPVYTAPDRPTPYSWPQAFPKRVPVRAPVIFDVDPAAKGLQLVIDEVLGARVRLD